MPGFLVLGLKAMAGPQQRQAHTPPMSGGFWEPWDDCLIVVLPVCPSPTQPYGQTNLKDK